MTTSVVNGFSYSRVSIFGECRNRIKSMWDILFGDRPIEWISFKPTLGAYVYPCYACKHLFSSFSSLQDHVNRRIIILNYKCDCKDTTLTFYNRCALLLHARRHFSLKEGRIDLSEVTTYTLPVELAGFMPVPNIPCVYEKEDEEEIFDDNAYINVQFYSPDENHEGKAIILMKPTDFLYGDRREPLCLRQVCLNIPKCKFITMREQIRLKELASKAEEIEPDLNSDVRIQLFDYADQFTLPIISKVESLHEGSLNAPRCWECNSDEGTTLAEHYQGNNKPVNPKLTCGICKFIASTRCSYKAHKRIHERRAPHVCPDCGKVFDTPEELNKHLEEVCYHLAKIVKYRCPGKRCSKLFTSTANFAVHFKQHFKCLYTCSACKSVMFLLPELEKHILLHKGNCIFTRLFKCDVCPDVGSMNEENYQKHIEVHSKSEYISMYVFLCRYCRNFFRSTFTFAAHLQKCGSKILADSKNRVGNKTKVTVTKKYFCILCNEQIPLEKKVSHLKTCKYARPVVYVNKLDIKYLEGSVNLSGKRSRSGESLKCEENGKRKRKRYLTDVNKRKKMQGTQPDLTAEKPVEFDGTYYCKLCEYHSTDRTEFHTHIRTHRNISTAYQCMECGECFVVKPSLRKHLLHFHNISDYESYLKDNDCFDVEAVKELESVMRLAPGESKTPVKENQCRVCLEEFEDSVALSKHFRTHGMAFLLKNTK